MTSLGTISPTLSPHSGLEPIIHHPADAPEVVSSDSTLHGPPKWGPRPSTPPEVVPPKEKRSAICGLAPTVFFLLVALAVVIIAAAVGGGVGGSIAVKNARSDGLAKGREEGRASAEAACATSASEDTATTTSEPTSTASEDASSTSSSAYEAPTDVILALDCPSLTGERTTISLPGSSTQYEYASECGVDRNSDGDERIDIVSVFVYSFEHCLRACSTYNRNRRGDECVAVTFMADLPDLRGNGGNCYLKSGRGARNAFDEDKRDLRVSALLVEN